MRTVKNLFLMGVTLTTVSCGPDREKASLAVSALIRSHIVGTNAAPHSIICAGGSSGTFVQPEAGGWPTTSTRDVRLSQCGIVGKKWNVRMMQRHANTNDDAGLGTVDELVGWIREGETEKHCELELVVRQKTS